MMPRLTPPLNAFSIKPGASPLAIFHLLLAVITAVSVTPLYAADGADKHISLEAQTPFFNPNIIRLTPDGRFAISSELLGSKLQLTELENGVILKVIQAVDRTESIGDFRVAPDSKRIVVSVSNSNKVNVLDLETGEVVKSLVLPAKNIIAGWHLSHDGNNLITHGTMFDHAQVFSLGTGRVVFNLLKPGASAKKTLIGDLMSDGVGSNDVTSDDKWLAGSTYPDKIAVFNAQSGRFVDYFAEAGQGRPDHVSFTRDGRHVLVTRAKTDDQVLEIWDFEKRELIQTVDGKYTARFREHYLFNGGDRILSIVQENDQKKLVLWDVASGQSIREFESGDAFAVSAGEDKIAAARASGGVYQTQIEPGKTPAAPVQTAVYAHEPTPVYGLKMLLGAFAVNGPSLALDLATGDVAPSDYPDCSPGAFDQPAALGIIHCRVKEASTLAIVDVATGREKTRLPIGMTYAQNIRYSDGDIYAFNAGAILKWSMAAPSRPQHHILEVQDKSDPKAYIQSGGISRDGKLFAGSENYSDTGDLIRVWSTDTGKQVFTLADPIATDTLISKNKKKVAAAHDDLEGVWFTNDGKHLISFGSERLKKREIKSKTAIKVWDLKSHALVRAIDMGDEYISGIIDGPSPSTVFAKSKSGTVFHLDFDRGTVIKKSEPLAEGYDGMVMSGDGKLLAVASDQSLFLVGAESLDIRVKLLVSDKGEWLVITPEGFFNASALGAEMLSVIQGLKPLKIGRVYDALYRPDLVAEKLAGDPKGLVKEAAAKLDLAKVLQSGAAPKVLITSPQPGTEAPSDEILVDAEIVDQGGSTGRVEWRVNGVTLGVEGERGLARLEGTQPQAAAPAPKSQKLSRTLFLDPGDNNIEIVAYNGANLIASEPARITVTLAATASISPPKLYVMAIGINDYYDGRLRLTYAVPDATQISAALQKAGAGHYESIEIVTLTDTQVTVDGLSRAFEALSKTVRPKDVLVFFAAGHGKTVDGRYYYLPRDFRYQTEASIAENGIGQDKWQAWFAKIPARKSILIYDTCESGTLTGQQQFAMRSGLEQQAALGRLIQATGRTVLTAATSDRPALEGYKGHGVFTYALLDGLGQGDRNGNGLIEVTELAGYIDAAVPEITQAAFGIRQLPQMSIQGSDFALVKKIDALGAAPVAASATAEVPSKPTHVVFEAVKVFKDAGGQGESVLELAPATTFAVVKTENGWSIVARDGKVLGYVNDAKIKRLQ